MLDIQLQYVAGDEHQDDLDVEYEQQQCLDIENK